MAGAIVLGIGWFSFSAGATTGSLAYACLLQRWQDMVAAPNKPTWWAVLGGLILLNHIRAHLQSQEARKSGSHDISIFPFEMYCQNLALIGYTICICLAQAFLSCSMNRHNRDGPLPFLEITEPSSLDGLRGRYSLYSWLLCTFPLPLSGPLAVLYIFPIGL